MLHSREVLIAELLGEVDTLLKRLEGLAPELEAARSRMAGSAELVTAAIDRFRLSTQAVVDQSQRSAVDYIVQRTNEAAVAGVKQQQALLQKAASDAFETQLAPRLAQLSVLVSQAMQEARRPAWPTWVPHAATAAVTAFLTGAGMFFLRG